MKKLISIIILSSLLFISCNKEDNKVKFKQVAVNNTNYNFNMPSISTDYNVTKSNLEKSFSSVVVDNKGNDVIINASKPKGDNNLFTSITATYHNDFNGFKSSNIAFTYSVKDIDTQSYLKIRELIKEQTTPKTK